MKIAKYEVAPNLALPTVEERAPNSQDTIPVPEETPVMETDFEARWGRVVRENFIIETMKILFQAHARPLIRGFFDFLLEESIW